MLEIQKQSGAEYVAYLTAKTANEKAQHDKDLELKDAQLQLLRKQLETSTTARASTPVRSRSPPLSAVFNSPEPVEEEEEHHESTPGPPGVN